MIKMDKIKKLHLNFSRIPAIVPKMTGTLKKKRRKQKLKNLLECRREKNSQSSIQEAGTLFAGTKSKKKKNMSAGSFRINSRVYREGFLAKRARDHERRFWIYFILFESSLSRNPPRIPNFSANIQFSF